jgi:NADH-quinone oxidoreductase subunit M
MKPGYMYIVNSYIFLPFEGCLNLLSSSKTNEEHLKLTALIWSCLTLICALVLWGILMNEEIVLQRNIQILWADLKKVPLGVNGIPIFIVLLSALLTPLCLLASWDSITKNIKEFLVLFLFLKFLLITSFLALSVLIFYMLFESTLIPMFFMIGNWGSLERKFLLHTIFYLHIIWVNFNVNFFTLF